MTAELPTPVQDAILARGELYEVGGSVRDRLMSVPLFDRDYLVQGIPMPELVEMLSQHGQADWVGRSFGVVKFTFRGDASRSRSTVDVALPRRERSTGPGHREFDVDYDPDLPLEDDLKRRDFTVNAMAVRMRDGTLIDPFGGRDDLKARLLRLIFPEAFREDPLRMLRALGLVARFGFALDSDLEARMRADVELLRGVSPERIALEFNKIFELARTPSPALRLMERTGILDVILPEMRPMVGCDQPGPYHAHDVFEHTCQTVDAAPPRLALRWAALLHDVEKPRTQEVLADKVTFYNHENLGARTARSVMGRWRYGHEITDHVAVLIERHLFNTDMGDKGLRRLIRAVGVPRMPDLLALRRADVAGQGMGASTDDVDEFEARYVAEVEAKSPFSRNDLALDGHDLMQELALPPGPRLGEILDFLMERVLDEPQKNDRPTLLQWAREYLDRGAVLTVPLILGSLTFLGG